MDNFVRKFLTEWRKLDLPFEGETFVAAVSGGADSVALLLALDALRKQKKLKNRFVVAHFNHDLRGKESENDGEFVKVLASRCEVEFVCKTAAGKSPKGNLEQNARNARYEFLRQTAQTLKAYGVLTAHTLNDQAETFLLNLVRGSGLEGLGGMKPVRRLESETFLIRPLLNWAKREDTENFCRSRNIEFRIDPMNRDETFNRVRIRKTVLPGLADLNPKIVEILAKTAAMLREDFEELQEITRQKVGEVKNELRLSEIKNLSPSSRSRVLRVWLKVNRGDLRRLDAKHFEAIDNLIFTRKSGKVIELPHFESVEKKNGKLIFKKNTELSDRT